MSLDQLLNKASKLGAKGFEVLGWKPPELGTDNPDGDLIIRKAPAQDSGTDVPWYDK